MRWRTGPSGKQLEQVASVKKRAAGAALEVDQANAVTEFLCLGRQRVRRKWRHLWQPVFRAAHGTGGCSARANSTTTMTKQEKCEVVYTAGIALVGGLAAVGSAGGCASSMSKTGEVGFRKPPGLTEEFNCEVVYTAGIALVGGLAAVGSAGGRASSMSKTGEVGFRKPPGLTEDSTKLFAVESRERNHPPWQRLTRSFSKSA